MRSLRPSCRVTLSTAQHSISAKRSSCFLLVGPGLVILPQSSDRIHGLPISFIVEGHAAGRADKAVAIRAIIALLALNPALFMQLAQCVATPATLDEFLLATRSILASTFRLRNFPWRERRGRPETTCVHPAVVRRVEANQHDEMLVSGWVRAVATDVALCADEGSRAPVVCPRQRLSN